MDADDSNNCIGQIVNQEKIQVIGEIRLEKDAALCPDWWNEWKAMKDVSFPFRSVNGKHIS